MNIFVDSQMSGERRRHELHRGAIFLHQPATDALRFCKLVQGPIEEAFHRSTLSESARVRFDRTRTSSKFLSVWFAEVRP
jgi:hypothetical protein